jgi:hypothetical protein
VCGTANALRRRRRKRQVVTAWWTPSLSVAEFLAADKGVRRAETIAAWTELKELDVPKDYASGVKARPKPKGKRSR